MLSQSRSAQARSIVVNFSKVSALGRHISRFTNRVPPRAPRGALLIHRSLMVSTAEDNMNVQLKDITVTARDGRVSHLDQVYIRGSHVRFFIVPDMLR